MRSAVSIWLTRPWLITLVRTMAWGCIRAVNSIFYQGIYESEINMKKILGNIVFVAMGMAFARQPAGAVCLPEGSIASKEPKGKFANRRRRFTLGGASVSNMETDSSGKQTRCSKWRGRTYLGTTYVAHTLDRNIEEKLVVQRDSVSCRHLSNT